MLFDSPIFFLFFLTLYPLWRAAPLRLGRWLLLAGSLLFYGWWSVRFLGLLLATTSLDWLLTRAMDGASPGRRKALLVASVVSNLATLATFKYLGFFSEQLTILLETLGLGSLGPSLTLVLPVGISFYTFQAIGYSVDVYRSELPPVRGYFDFLLFITFFPHMVAGPIQRSALLLPQLKPMSRPSADQVATAAWLLCWGFFKKDVVADNLAPLVAQGFDGQSPGGFGVLLASYAFTWQIYCDFSGYSDIARGLAKLFGVELLENFRRPFFAETPSELWRRWHISLSQWLRDYLYIPLGGSQRAPYRNLMLTMLLGGLWHGANWTYLLWGAWHGLALVLGRLLPRPRVPGWVLAILTFHVTMVGFMFFRATDLRTLGSLLSELGHGLQPRGSDLAHLRLFAALVSPVLLLELIQERGGGTFAQLTWPRPAQTALYATVTVAILFLGSTYATEFIYFQF
jgi:alginate O-acetyltransferase complex protein AlgI